MKDVRKIELVHMLKISEYLASTYPEYFTLTKYDHPVWGNRASLVVLPYASKIDIQIIQSVSINFELNTIFLITEIRSYEIHGFLKDETVI